MIIFFIYIIIHEGYERGAKRLNNSYYIILLRTGDKSFY